MKQLKRFPDYYITEDAEIISKRTNNQKKLTQCVDQFGYLRVGLRTLEGKTKVERIHRLMIETYGKEPPKGMKNPTVDHINGDKLDNRIDNLQWLSNEDNAYKSAKDRTGSYKIQNKNGEIFIIENLNDWCRKNNLDSHCLRRSYIKGWWHKDYKIIEKQVP
jgi:hypothetical protein